MMTSAPPHLPVAIAIFVILSGAVIGSFLSMLVYRLPIILKRNWERDCRETLALPHPEPGPAFNLAWPGSHCPECQTALGLRDNVPLLGFLMLRGRCRHCHARIPGRYFLIEVLTAIAAIATVAHFGLTARAGLAFLLTAGLIALSFIDMKEQILPDVITLPLLWVGLLANTAGFYTSLPSAVWGATSAYLFLWLIFHAFRFATGKEGMGYGDFKLFAVAGAWLGWQMLPLVILLASLTGAVYGMALIVTGRLRRSTPMPFGPFLCLATWIGLFFGGPILAGYLHMAHGHL